MRNLLIEALNHRGLDLALLVGELRERFKYSGSADRGVRGALKGR
jgi:hypothetical protein